MDFPGEKLLIKFWETLAEKGIGSLLGPWQERRMGKARNEIKAQEIRKLAQAEKDAEDIRSGKKQLQGSDIVSLLNGQNTPSLNPDEHIESVRHIVARGIIADAMRSEINLANAILFAEEQLESDTQDTPTQDVDEDWLFRWRECAGKVSAKDLQQLWGSILAGEVKTPGRYSMRTLEFLKTLSKAEAEIICMLASYVIGKNKIYREPEVSSYLESKGLDFSKLLYLQELGVITGVDSIGIESTYKSSDNEEFSCVLTSHGKVLVVEHDNPSKTLVFHNYILSEIGKQVLSLGSFEPDIEYLRLIGKNFIQDGFRVKLADWHYSDESKTIGGCSNAQEILVGDS